MCEHMMCMFVYVYTFVVVVDVSIVFALCAYKRVRLKLHGALC
jgi:hypothetical protein